MNIACILRVCHILKHVTRPATNEPVTIWSHFPHCNCRRTPQHHDHCSSRPRPQRSERQHETKTISHHVGVIPPLLISFVGHVPACETTVHRTQRSAFVLDHTKTGHDKRSASTGGPIASVSLRPALEPAAICPTRCSTRADSNVTKERSALCSKVS